ncbi:MAG: sigma-70 family RNA polymerase sigma factor [Clostridia bacterium]|nr:sigma-70 family RNA polymerase sigma factor [Clostridia bacterium]
MKLLFFIKRLFGISKIAEIDDNDLLFYINGPQSLPPPLSAEEENEALFRMKTDPNAKKLLIEHNLRLVVYIAKRFESTGIGIEDLISIGTIGLIKGVNTFKEDKNIKLATYCSRCIENEILMFIRKNTYLKAEISLDEPINVDWDGNELLVGDVLGSDPDSVSKGLEDYEEKKLIKRLVEALDERERQIIELRFGLRGGRELTQKEVADLLGVSQSYISRLEKRIIERLKAEIESRL